jgi:hypothetical protein
VFFGAAMLAATATGAEANVGIERIAEQRHGGPLSGKGTEEMRRRLRIAWAVPSSEPGVHQQCAQRAHFSALRQVVVYAAETA